MSGVPRFGDSLKGITGLSIQLYSWIRFIMAKGYKAKGKSAKRKGEWGEV